MEVSPHVKSFGKMNDTGKVIMDISILGICGILMIFAYFSPILISYLTENWWYMFLFLISWIPTLGVLIILKGLLHLTDNI